MEEINKTEFQRLVLEANEEADAKETVDKVDEPFSGLDLRSALCFGYSTPFSKCWKCLADQSEEVGYKLIDQTQLEKSLEQDVERSYLKIAQFKLVDVDDDMKYSLWFDNNKALWNIEIANSPKAEITIEERADFFKSEMFKKIAKKTYYRILNAKKTFDKNVKFHCDNGELLLVDTVKLDAILHFLELDYFLKNVLNGKYLNY